jgi:hypothetical protein
MFAAMALSASGSSGDDSYGDQIVPASDKKAGAAPAAAAVSSTKSSPTVNRRRGRRPEALDTVTEAVDATTTTETAAPGSMEMFAAAASQTSDHNSGTFKLSSPTSSSSSSHHHNIAEKSNLDAALAALEKDDNQSSSAAAAANAVPLNMPFLDHDKAARDNGQAGATEAAAAKAANVPMFAEQVIMSRPLFFGALLPPRVIRQARLMVVTAQQKQKQQQYQKQKQSGPNSPVTNGQPSVVRLSQMPVSVRNIVGAIRTYGHGIDVWQEEEEIGQEKPPDVTSDNENDNNNKDDESSNAAAAGPTAADWRGSPHVSTFQPVWSDVLRVKRVEERAKLQRRRQRPAGVERGSTAPARLAGNLHGLVHVDEVDSEYNDDNDDKREQDDVGGGVDKKDKDNQGPLSPQTRAGQSTAGDKANATASGSGSDSGGMNNNSANELFSMWLRADDDTNAPASTDGSGPLAVGGGGGSMRSVERLVSPRSNNNKDEAKAKETPKPAKDVAPKPLTEQEMFSQWACGSDPSVGSTLQNSSENVFNPSTFQKMPSLGPDDSDDDSVIDDELKKQVGMNDHLSKAVASLAGPGDGRPQADITAEESQLLLSRAPRDASRGRPLTNYELTNGCVPLFGVDDSPLPVEGDLGIHETKEEQQRSNEHKRSQDIIEKFVAPNVFGPIACPNPALNQDDCHSWNSRATPAHRFTGGTSQLPDHNAQQLPKRQSSGALASPDNASAATKASKAGSKSQKDASSSKKKFASRSRYGWWNVADAVEDAAVENPQVIEADKKSGKKEPAVEPPLQLPPTHHSSSGLQVISLLEPTPEELREDNLPLSRMHAASSMTQTLPYLSDRPPSHRYLQVDTQAVGFPAIGGEVEPLFCSLAIYNVETVSSSVRSVSENSAAPVPDLQRCGRVTEALNFDVISDQEIAEKCSGVLWPYATTTSEEERLQSTRCGVFPLPSNLNVANLYAVLVVRKVLADDSELDAYLKGGKHSSDLAKLRSNARKSSNRRGNFLMPFAFGVAPLLQVFGMDNPVIASSRAVQIPLFRFTPALGERQILDHIMVMLYPR